MSDNLGIQFDEGLFIEELKAWVNKLATESPSNVWTSSVTRTTPDYDASTLWCDLYPNRMISPDLAHDGQFWGIPLNAPKIKEILKQRDAVTESWGSEELDEFLGEFKQEEGGS